MVVAINLYLFCSTLITYILIFAIKRYGNAAHGTVIGVKRGSIYDIETVQPNERIVLTVFGAHLWSRRFDAIWLTAADRCEDSFRLKKAIYYLDVIDEHSYENVLVLQLKSGLPESTDETYRLCTRPAVAPLSVSNRVSRLASRRPFALIMPLYALIIALIFMIMMSALLSGLNLSFTSVAVSELNILIRMGDAYQSRLARNIIPVRRHLNWLICTFATANAIVNCLISLSFEMLLQNLSNGRMPFVLLTFIPCIFIVIFAELLPLAICHRRGLVIASKTRMFTWFCLIVLSPFAWPLSKILDRILGRQECGVYDRSKIEYLILEAARRNTSLFSEILKNAINLPRIKVGNVMTKIDEAFLLSTTDSLDYKLILTIVEKGYTRIPVYEGSMRNKVIAVLNVKDLITTDINKDVIVIDVLKKLNYMKQVRFVCEEMQVKPLMNEMEGQNFEFEPKGYISHMAMVVKYDSRSYRLAGLITLDDIIEEIFGEMKDEMFQWTNRRMGIHRDQATFDWLRSESNPLNPLEQIVCIQDTLEKYPGFKELTFNIHSMRRLFDRCKPRWIKSGDHKICLYRKKIKSRSMVVVLIGKPFCFNEDDQYESASPYDLGSQLVENIFMLLLESGTKTDLSSLHHIPKRSVYIKPPCCYLKVTVHTLIEILLNDISEDLRREVSDAGYFYALDNAFNTQSMSSPIEQGKFRKIGKMDEFDVTQTEPFSSVSSRNGTSVTQESVKSDK